jgi:uncharacterized protein
MKIFLHEITDIDTELDFTHEEKWVSDAVARVDEIESRKQRAIRTHLNLRKVDDVVVIQGDIETELRLLCSRCAAPFGYAVHPDFSALFCRDPDMAGIAHLERNPADRRAPGRPVGQNRGFARHAHDFSADASAESGKDLDITYISHDFVDLGEVLTEQLQLQVPFQPLCRDSCKGICPRCGADLNVGRCACAKIVKDSPFAVLMSRARAETKPGAQKK